MKAFLGSVIERIVTVIIILLFVQFPLFMQQYQQQLVGRMEELSMQVQAMQKSAGKRSLVQYIQKFQSSADPDFSNHGDFLYTLFDRYESLTLAYTSLNEASSWSKPFIFLRHFQNDVAYSTLSHYDLGLPLNLEGAVYALIGLLFGMVVFRPAYKKSFNH